MITKPESLELGGTSFALNLRDVEVLEGALSREVLRHYERNAETGVVEATCAILLVLKAAMETCPFPPRETAALFNSLFAWAGVEATMGTPGAEDVH